MKKIKKFKIKARPSYVMRGLRALLENPQVTPELETAVEKEVESALPRYSTAAVYDTLDRQKTPEWAAPLCVTEPETGAEPVAITLYAATIGTNLEEDLGDALQRGEALRSKILTALGDESAEQAANFITRLITDEAKDEGCVLAARANVDQAELQREILQALDSPKVQIQMDGVGHTTPRFTKVGHILWYPPAKRRRTAEKG